MTIRCGLRPASNRSTTGGSVQSPQIIRCLPSTHTSPGMLTGVGRQIRNVVRVSQAGGPVGGQLRQLLGREANQAHVECHGSKIVQFECQHRFVPTGVQCQFVVGKHIRPSLRLRPPRSDHHRHVVQPKHPGGQNASMPGNNSARLVYQHRHRPAPFSDAGGKLSNLGVGVRPRVTRVWNERGDRSALDVVGWPLFGEVMIVGCRLRDRARHGHAGSLASFADARVKALAGGGPIKCLVDPPIPPERRDGFNQAPPDQQVM